MNKKYIIQIEKESPYPFQGIKLQGLEYAVRVNHNSLAYLENQQLGKNLKLLMKVDSPVLIALTQILEIRGKGFVVDYEYVPSLLKNSTKLQEPTFIAELKVKIYSFFQALTQKSISCFPSLDQIGLTEEGDPKIYISLDFEHSTMEKSQLLLKYQRWNEQLFSTIVSLKESAMMRSQITLPSDYSQIFGQKILDLEQKLGKMKGRSSSEYEREKPKEKKVNMVLEYFPPKKNRNNSYCPHLGAQQLSQFERRHRSSLDESVPQNNRIREEVQKLERKGLKESRQRILTEQCVGEVDLSSRVSKAMEKSKFAFKMFEKWHRKVNKR